MAKVVEVRHTHGGVIVDLHFVNLPRRGWFKENVQPMVDLIKTTIPAGMREYNPSSFTWSIDASFWPPIKTILEAGNWILKDVTDNSNGVHVDKDYAENFYYAPTAPTPAESPEAIAKALATFFSLDIADFNKTSQKDLKKLYRQSARELHPDLGGDATKMSELNRLWAIFNTKEVQIQ